MRGSASRVRVSFYSVENVPEFNSADGCTQCDFLKNHRVEHCKRTNFRGWELRCHQETNKQKNQSKKVFKDDGGVFLPNRGINWGSLTRISAHTTQVSQETPLTFLPPYPEMGYSRRQRPCVDVLGQMDCTRPPRQTQSLCQHRVSGGVENKGLPAWDGTLKRDTQPVPSHAFGNLYVTATHAKSALAPDGETELRFFSCIFFFFGNCSPRKYCMWGIGHASVAFSEMLRKLN